MTEKSPLLSYFARLLRYLSPVFAAECPDATEIAFEKVLYKLVYRKTIVPTVADKARSQVCNQGSQKSTTIGLVF